MPYTEAEVSLEEYLSVSIALYRKYRSQQFDELIGQDHVTRSLKNALKSGRISHAYLFSGPRGIGKTSAARILAREVNGIEASEELTNLDIIEIDAASNRRIDEIRDLREKVHIAPTKSKYKVYIIDEVHMLTREAFNALLKTLEEPPAHVIFILATTEPHKLPDTIISRTQHFTFRSVGGGKVEEHLKSIAKEENIKIEAAALSMLARAGGGSIRDSISLLDQLANMGSGEISATAVADILGFADMPLVEGLAEAIARRDPRAALKALGTLWSQGASPSQVLTQSLEFWREALHQKLNQQKSSYDFLEALSAPEIAAIIKSLSSLPVNTPHLEAVLDATILEHCLVTSTQEPASTAQPETQSRSQAPVATKEPAKARSSAPTKAAASKASAKAKKTTKTTKTATKGKTFSDKVGEDQWLKALSLIKARNNSLYALLRSASPEFKSDKVVVTFRFLFHKRRLEEAKNRQLLEAALEKVTGQAIPVVTEVSQAPTTGKTAPAAEKDSQAAAVLDILGGEIVTQSKAKEE